MILPPGTKVVLRYAAKRSDGGRACPPGTVGIILRSPIDPDHAYEVRAADGAPLMLRRTAFAVLKEVQREGFQVAEHPLDEYRLRASVVYRCVVGSRAYGLEHADSDTDRRGVYLPPAALHWSLFGVPEQLEDDAAQECYWEMEKFIVLALKANPAVLECLYSPLVEQLDPIAAPLIDERRIFLSKLVYQTYNGYVISQFRKLESDLRNAGRVRWKHAMHLIRLLMAGIVILREHVVPLRLEAERDLLLAIRDGERPLDDVNALRARLHAEFEAAFEQTTLPERPDYERASELLVAARRQRAREDALQ